MRGEGFECDECSKRVVVEGHNSFLHQNPFVVLPAGWVVVGSRAVDPAAQADRSEFCSWACVAAYSSTQAGGF